jgi:hypothetical protein
LFNNYSGVLTGQARSINSRKSVVARIQNNGISHDYGLQPKDPFLFRNSINLLNKILSIFGPKKSLKIKKYLKLLLRF